MIENDDPDSPEAFGVKQYLNSPVAKLAASCGFVRDDENRSDERWVKKLANGKEAWLRASDRNREWEEPMDFKDPSGRKGGREWELLEVTPTHACKHCNQERTLSKKPCPHCKQKAPVVSFPKFKSLIRANEVVMSYTLGAFMQRLATWPEGVPKNFEETTRQLVRTKILEGLGVDDPDDPESVVKREVASRDWENILLRNGFKHRDMGILGYERTFGASAMVNVGHSTKPDNVLITVYYRTQGDRWQQDHMESVPIRDMLDYINDCLPVAHLHEARQRKVSVPVPVPDPDDPVVSVNNFVQSKIPYVPDYMAVLRALEAHPEMSVHGKLTRHGNYVHQNSTSFEMSVDDPPEQLDILGGDFWRTIDRVEKLIKEEVVNINNKIYRALEQEHDYLQSDDAVVDSIKANDYKYDEEGVMDAGDLEYDQLGPDAQERARDNYREGNLDYEWWDHIYEEWIAELEEMGWHNPEINFSGFASQGDGASFTATGLDFKKWAAWHMSNKVIEKGHPYTDDLPVEESVQAPDADDPQMFMQQYLQTYFDDSAILKVYEYINDHQFDNAACENCEGTGDDPAFANALDFVYHPCPACGGEGEHEDGSYREVVRLWNKAGKELKILFTRLEKAEKTLTGKASKRKDRALQRLFDYMQDPDGNYVRVTELADRAGTEIENAINRLRALDLKLAARKPGPRYESNVDDPQQYIDELPAKPNPGEMVNLTCPNCGKTRVREQPAPPMTLDPVCCGRRLRESDDVDDPQPHYIEQAVAKLKPGTLVQSQKLNYRYAGSPPLQGSVQYATRKVGDDTHAVVYNVVFPRHQSSFDGYYDHDDLIPLNELGEGYNFPDQGEQDKPEHWDDGEPPDVDDPSAVLKHEVAQRSEPIKELEVRGRRWYRRGAGGVYCKAYIYINDKLVHVTPEQYGYGDHYLTLATDWLRRNGYLDDLLPDPRDPIWYLRDKHGIKLQYGVRDVPRERDL